MFGLLFSPSITRLSNELERSFSSFHMAPAPETFMTFPICAFFVGGKESFF
jgi:hypothetical protein